MVHPVHAQPQPTDRVVRLGIICGARCEGAGYDALTEGLARLGWIEGRNLIVDRRGGGGEQQRLPALAAELVAFKPDVLIAVGPQSTRAAKEAAGTIPIVMVAVADPVGTGLVQSQRLRLCRPRRLEWVAKEVPALATQAGREAEALR